MRRFYSVLAMIALMQTAAATENSKAEVHIDNFSFSPASLTVAVGTSVSWINRDDIPHTVVNTDQPLVFKSHALDTDQTYSFTFTTPGRYAYFCSLHPHMQGIIIVK